MKFDSYPRFIKSELYKECLLRDISGQPLPLRGKPDANLQLHQNPPLHQSLSTNVSEIWLIVVQFSNSIIVIWSTVSVRSSDRFQLSFVELNKSFAQRFVVTRFLEQWLTASYLLNSFVRGCPQITRVFLSYPPPPFTPHHSSTWHFKLIKIITFQQIHILQNDFT